MIANQALKVFMQESLGIEGITRPVTHDEMVATQEFLALETVGIDDLVNLVGVYAPCHVLRSRGGLNVSVGGYDAPEGGPLVVKRLLNVLVSVKLGDHDPWQNHVDYEMLHPFTDGNGRSGRTLWLWQMLKEGHNVSLPFLHRFYYQTLAAQRIR